MKKIAIIGGVFCTILTGSAVWAYSRTSNSPVSLTSPAIEVSGSPAEIIALLDMMPLPRELEDFARSDKREGAGYPYFSSDLQLLSPTPFERGWRIVVDGDSYLTITAKASAGSRGKTLLDMTAKLEDSPFTRDTALMAGDKHGIERFIDVVATEYVRDVTSRKVPDERAIGKRIDARLGVFDRWLLKGVKERAALALEEAMRPLVERMKAAMESEMDTGTDSLRAASGDAASMAAQAAHDAASAADVARDAAHSAAQAAGAPYEPDDDDSTDQNGY